MARLAWKDEFNLNVDYIDNAELNRIYAHRLPEHGIIWKTDYDRP